MGSGYLTESPHDERNIHVPQMMEDKMTSPQKDAVFVFFSNDFVSAAKMLKVIHQPLHL